MRFKAENLVYGINTIEAALAKGYIVELFLLDDARNERLKTLHHVAVKNRIPVTPCSREDLDKLALSPKHQGAVGIIKEITSHSLEEVIYLSLSKENSTVLLLDEVQDPRNLGAIIRTAAATDVFAVVLPKRETSPLSATVFKASAGTLFLVRMVLGQNLHQALRLLKKHGYWIASLHLEGKDNLFEFRFPKRVALVIGSEGKGVSPLLIKESDFFLKIPMSKCVESLNVSVAAGCTLYRIYEQHSGRPSL